MAEGVDPISIAVGHGARRIESEVAAHKLHAYRRTGRKSVLVSRHQGRQARPSADSRDRLNAGLLQFSGKHIDYRLGHAGEGERRGDRRDGLADEWYQRRVDRGAGPYLGHHRRGELTRIARRRSHQRVEAHAPPSWRLYFTGAFEDVDHVL